MRKVFVLLFVIILVLTSACGEKKELATEIVPTDTTAPRPGGETCWYGQHTLHLNGLPMASPCISTQAAR